MGQFKFDLAGIEQNNVKDDKLTNDALKSLIASFRKRAGRKLKKKPQEEAVGVVEQDTEGN